MNISNYSDIILTKGTILYSGGRYNSCLSKYIYIGQGGHKSDGRILYLSPNENTAIGYAINKSQGIIKKYVVAKDLILKDITENMSHYDYDELYPFCLESDGYYLDWGMSGNLDHVEIALCNAPEKIEYIGCKKYSNIKDPYEYECVKFCEDDSKFGGKTKRRKGRKPRTKKRYNIS